MVKNKTDACSPNARDLLSGLTYTITTLCMWLLFNESQKDATVHHHTFPISQCGCNHLKYGIFLSLMLANATNHSTQTSACIKPGLPSMLT